MKLRFEKGFRPFVQLAKKSRRWVWLRSIGAKSTDSAEELSAKVAKALEAAER